MKEFDMNGYVEIYNKEKSNDDIFLSVLSIDELKNLLERASKYWTDDNVFYSECSNQIIIQSFYYDDYIDASYISTKKLFEKSKGLNEKEVEEVIKLFENSHISSILVKSVYTCRGKIKKIKWDSITNKRYR